MSTKTKTHKTIKLPKGLPKLPPVPDGFSHWKLCGWGAKIKGQYITTSKGDSDWDQLRSVNTESMAYKQLYYALAVKHPAPAKKKAVKKKRDAWTYSEYRATLRKNGKAFAIVTPDGRNALELPKIQELLSLLNGGAK